VQVESLKRWWWEEEKVWMKRVGAGGGSNVGDKGMGRRRCLCRSGKGSCDVEVWALCGSVLASRVWVLCRSGLAS
jgi:hypothetical protein